MRHRSLENNSCLLTNVDISDGLAWVGLLVAVPQLEPIQNFGDISLTLGANMTYKRNPLILTDVTLRLA